MLHGEIHGEDYIEKLLDLWVESVFRTDELPFVSDDLNKIACPTLVIHGDRDEFFPLHVPVAMYQDIPNSQLCIIPNGGHNLLNENPALFIDTLLTFLKKNAFE